MKLSEPFMVECAEEVEPVVTLGYVVIEYNQASGWPQIWSQESLYDTEAEARQFADEAEDANRLNGRRETYRVARVELVG